MTLRPHGASGRQLPLSGLRREPVPAEVAEYVSRYEIGFSPKAVLTGWAWLVDGQNDARQPDQGWLVGGFWSDYEDSGARTVGTVWVGLAMLEVRKAEREAAEARGAARANRVPATQPDYSPATGDGPRDAAQWARDAYACGDSSCDDGFGC